MDSLCVAFAEEPVALYAGGDASFVQRCQERRSAPREQIKRRVQDGEIRLVCATDAACEGLNLQRRVHAALVVDATLLGDDKSLRAERGFRMKD